VAARGRSGAPDGVLSAGAAHYYARVYGAARAGCLAELRRAGCREEEAEDIFATTLERIMGKFDPTGSTYAQAQVVSLLKKACLQKLVDERRHRGVLRMVPLEEAANRADESAGSPAEVAEKREAVAMGREAIDSLPARDRRLFLQRHQLRLTPEEIQRANPGLSRRTYRKVIHRANARALAAFEEIQSGSRCERMRSEYMRRYVAGEASEKELEAVRLHLRGCRACRARAAQMRSHLHDVAAGLAGTLLAGCAGRGHQPDLLARLLGAALDRGQAAADATRLARERFRELALRAAAGAPGTAGDPVAGQVAGLPVAKAVSLCAGALAAGCLAAGVVPALGPLEPAAPAGTGAQRDGGSRPARAVRTTALPATAATGSPAPRAASTPGKSEGRSEKKALPAGPPQGTRRAGGYAASDGQRAGAEFGADAAGAGQPFVPLPSAAPAPQGDDRPGGDGGQVTRSRSGGPAPAGESQGGSEFGM
jgi:RNA polymerase sigma factor (sigma-70 family)